MALVEDAGGNIYDDGTDYSNEGRSYSTDMNEYQLDTQGDGGSPINSSMTNLSGLSGIFGPYKALFNKISSGSAGANEYAAALGILGLLIPSLNKPNTGGWNGSIDLSKQYVRTPIAQPEYKPYAQSAAPVMGRQFFNTTYSTPSAAPAAPGAPAAPAVPGASVVTPGTGNPDLDNPSSTGGRAAGGLIGMARGGHVRLQSGDFVIPADVVAFAGNGSSAAGKEVLSQAINAVPIDIPKGDGMSDDIGATIDGVQPAAVARDEMLVRAKDVAAMGNGDTDRGADALYAMMDRIRKHSTGSSKQIKPIEDVRKFTPGGIAGYAGGGAIAFNNGGSAGTPTAPLGSSTETNISEWAGPYVGDMLSKTAALTNTPYQAYQGPMVAGTAPLQSKVFEGLQGLNFPGQLGQSFSAQGAYQLPSSGGAAQGATGIAAQYMNPYLSAVLTPQLEELRRQSQITQMGTAGKLAQAGAFGGSRQAIMDAETQRNLLQEQNKAIGTGYANAYDRAMGQFNTEQGQAKTLADMMAGAGQQQRGIEQEGITALQRQYETELLDPYTKLRFQKEMLSGLPVQTVSTTGNTSTMGQLGSGFENISKLMKQLNLS